MSGTVPSDPDITLTLPLSTWKVVMAHLGRGQFCDVAEIVEAMGIQADPQIKAAQSAPRQPVRSHDAEAARARKLQ